jgi:hypothetical protein
MGHYPLAEQGAAAKECGKPALARYATLVPPKPRTPHGERLPERIPLERLRQAEPKAGRRQASHADRQETL